MTQYVLVAPASLFVDIQQLNGQRRAEWYARFGVPAMERAGVARRRCAFAHAWTAEELAWMQEVAARLPTVTLQPALPADWRWPGYRLSA